jgi:hypothetical protein
LVHSRPFHPQNRGQGGAVPPHLGLGGDLHPTGSRSASTAARASATRGDSSASPRRSEADPSGSPPPPPTAPTRCVPPPDHHHRPRHHPTTCKGSPRTPVKHLPGLDTYRDGALPLSASPGEGRRKRSERRG